MKPLPRAFGALALPLLWLCVLGSAAAVIYTKHRQRELFVELEHLNAGRDAFDAEWGRLQLEQSYWSNYGSVESIADARLHMHIPASREVELPPP